MKGADRGLSAEDAIWNYVRARASDQEASGQLKLPTERDFSTRFSLPRSAVRRALLRLERQGLIVRQVGRGTFIQANKFAQPQASQEAVLSDASPVQLIAARIALEPSIALEAARNAVGANFRDLAAAIDASTEAISLKQYEDADQRFHLGLARATHNIILIDSMKLIVAARLNASWGRLKEISRVLEPERRRAVREEHLAILDAVMARDGQVAKRRTRDHLERVKLRMLGHHISDA